MSEYLGLARLTCVPYATHDRLIGYFEQVQDPLATSNLYGSMSDKKRQNILTGFASLMTNVIDQDMAIKF